MVGFMVIILTTNRKSQVPEILSELCLCSTRGGENPFQKAVGRFTKVFSTLYSPVNWFHHPLVLGGGEFCYVGTTDILCSTFSFDSVKNFPHLYRPPHHHHPTPVS